VTVVAKNDAYIYLNNLNFLICTSKYLNILYIRLMYIPVFYLYVQVLANLILVVLGGHHVNEASTLS
jgi:hypothetical protein